MALIDRNDVFSLELFNGGDVYKLRREDSHCFGEDWMYITKEEMPKLLEVLKCMGIRLNATNATEPSKSILSPQEKVDAPVTDKTCV